MAGKKGKSGGNRKDAGRKKIIRNFTSEVKEAVVKAAEELAKEYREPVEKAILRLIYSDKIQDTVKVGIAKWYSDILVVKETEKTIKHQEYPGPVIGLPPSKADPAKIIPLEGGKKG